VQDLLIIPSDVYRSTSEDLYQYVCYPKKTTITTKNTNSYWYINKSVAGCFTGNGSEFSDFLVCVEILGYTPETRTSSYSRGTDLPYVNGCSTKQLINPARLGDPTWQLLHIPPMCMEQTHHIHSTGRVVYVIDGEGVSIAGTPENSTKYELTPGMCIILPKMVPHHFTAGPKGLLVAPLHIFSSTSLENQHPMFHGTHMV